MLCRIEWKALPTGMTGHGDWFPLSRVAMLQAHIKLAAKEFPDIDHWIAYQTETPEPTMDQRSPL